MAIWMDRWRLRQRSASMLAGNVCRKFIWIHRKGTERWSDDEIRTGNPDSPLEHLKFHCRHCPCTARLNTRVCCPYTLYKQVSDSRQSGWHNFQPIPNRCGCAYTIVRCCIHHLKVICVPPFSLTYDSLWALFMGSTFLRLWVVDNIRQKRRHYLIFTIKIRLFKMPK